MTRSFDATRLTTLAAIACLTDTVLRVTASDVPSVLSAHYSGTADGPGEAFCFDAGHFALESEYARFHDPLLVCTRGGGREVVCFSRCFFFLLALHIRRTFLVLSLLFLSYSLFPSRRRSPALACSTTSRPEGGRLAMTTCSLPLNRAWPSAQMSKLS